MVALGLRRIEVLSDFCSQDSKIFSALITICVILKHKKEGGDVNRRLEKPDRSGEP